MGRKLLEAAVLLIILGLVLSNAPQFALVARTLAGGVAGLTKTFQLR